jgi:hypothetical protein
MTRTVCNLHNHQAAINTRGFCGCDAAVNNVKNAAQIVTSPPPSRDWTDESLAYQGWNELTEEELEALFARVEPGVRRTFEKRKKALDEAGSAWRAYRRAELEVACLKPPTEIRDVKNHNGLNAITFKKPGARPDIRIPYDDGRGYLTVGWPVVAVWPTRGYSAIAKEKREADDRAELEDRWRQYELTARCPESFGVNPKKIYGRYRQALKGFESTRKLANQLADRSDVGASRLRSLTRPKNAEVAFA